MLQVREQVEAGWLERVEWMGWWAAAKGPIGAIT